MTVYTLMLMGIIPAALVVLGGWRIFHSTAPEKANRRFLIYLLIVGDGLFLVEFVMGLIFPQGSQVSWQVTSLLMPTGLCVLVLILTRLKALKGASLTLKLLALLLGLGALGLLVSLWTQPYGWAQTILSGALLLASVWLLTYRYQSAAVLLGLICLAGLVVYNSVGDYLGIYVYPNAIVRTILPIILYTLPGLVVVTAAALIYSGLMRINKENIPSENSFLGRVPIILRLLLGASLLTYLAFTTYWMAIWDQTSDGLGQIVILFTACPLAIGAGILMALASSGWRRKAGLVFCVFVPVLLIGASQSEWGIYQSITKQRAATIQAAVENFHAHNGHYPAALQDLVPRELLWVPDLIMLRGESWCYQGGDDYYQLGSIYRDFFSSPMSYRVYASAGDPPAEPSSCEKRLAELKEKYDPQPVINPIANSSAASQPPLPTSQVSIPRTPISPLINTSTVQIGSWSQDGQYWFFAIPELSGKQISVSLDFLISKTGKLCNAGPKFTVSSDLSYRHAWLPDGRLLFLSANGDLVLVTPCQADVENLTTRYPETFTQILTPFSNAGLAHNQKILLKSAHAYWLLDSSDMQLLPIPELRSDGSDQSWNTFAWSMAGDRLAIIMPIEDSKESGNILFIIDTENGEVVQRLTLPGPSANNFPSIEWLSDHELLVSGQDMLSLIDLEANPPRASNVFKDLFSLDIAFPNDISSLATLPDPSGKSFKLAVRINHPRNQNIYIYYSDSGKTEILHPSMNALLFFSNGDWTELSKLEDMNHLQDTFDLYWPDSPEMASQQLAVLGHIPRNYPSLNLKYLTNKSQILLGSSQGISLVSMPDGKLLGFWELSDQKYHMQPSMLVSPDHRMLVVYAEGDGLYTIALDQ